jgi:DNA-binding response OmpR family regulator
MTARPVLLIDSDTAWCEEVCRFLEPRGYAVTSTDTQAVALQRLAAGEDAPLAIFIDPAVTDRKFCCLLRAIPELDKVPVFVISDAPANAVYHKGAGADGYVRKAVALDHLSLLLGDVSLRPDFDGDASRGRAA